MAEESKIEQNFNAPVFGVAGVVQGDQNIYPPATPQAEKPAELPNNLNRARTGAVNFVGREDAMAQLHDQLQQQERIAITAVVTGMAGVGKTELALQYALYHREKSTYAGGICWIGVQGETVGVQLLDFAKSLLGLFPPEELNLRGQLDYCWARWQPPGDVLLILDDVHQYAEIQDYLPPQEQRFKVLITTRQHWLAASFEQLRLPVLSESAALALLESLIGASRLQAELEVGKGLCAWLGYLPLGLELVGRFLKRRTNWTLARMQQQLIDKGLQLSALQNPSADMTAQRGVEAAFELSWEALNQPARDLGCFLSLFALAPIPWRLVIERCLSAEDEEELEDIREEQLLNLHLLQAVEGEVYQFHPLVRQFFQKQLAVSENLETIKQDFVEVIVTKAKNILAEPLCKDVDNYFPHLEEIKNHFQNYLNLNPEKLRWLYMGLGRLNIYYGHYTKARYYCEKCLELSQQIFGRYSSEIGDDYNSLGLVFYHIGQYQEAKNYLRQGLEIREVLFKKDNRDIAESYNNLGELYFAINDYNTAEYHLEKALEIRQKIYEFNSCKEAELDISESLNNLAGLYCLQGQFYDSKNTFLGIRSSRSLYDQAKSKCKQALEIKIRQLGENDYDVIQNQINLAEIYRLIKNYQDAELLLNTALNNAQVLLGNNHLKVADLYNNLGVLYAEQNRFYKAIENIEKAREIFLKILDDEHPRTKSTAQNLHDIREELQNF
jgi:tetratricopeptide (TPR) repeat protein